MYINSALGCQLNLDIGNYIQLNIDSQRVCGVGHSVDIIQASLDGILSGINVAARLEQEQAA